MRDDAGGTVPDKAVTTNREQGDTEGRANLAPTPDYKARGQYFGDTAHGYDARRQRSAYDRWKWRREHAAVGRALAELAPVAGVLDLPTGTGRFLGQLAARATPPGVAAQTVGADISLDMLDLSRCRIAEDDLSSHGGPISLLAAEAERLPFADGAFDLVVSIRFFQHLPPAAVGPILAELHRVSRRGVLVQAPLAQDLSPAVRATSRLLHRFSGGRLGSLVRQDTRRFFPTSRADLNGMLADLGLRVHSSRVVTWRGGQLRLIHVHR